MKPIEKINEEINQLARLESAIKRELNQPGIDQGDTWKRIKWIAAQKKALRRERKALLRRRAAQAEQAFKQDRQRRRDERWVAKHGLG